MNARVRAEARRAVESLTDELPKSVDGMAAVHALKTGGSRHWRQMEWIGFWFEHFGLQALLNHLGGQRGPRYGRTEFDYTNEFVWDLKAHPVNSSSGAKNAFAILNDTEAIESCIGERGYVGFLIARGHAQYDHDGAFRDWHDALKGKTSQYQLTARSRGAPRRTRKSAFNVDGLSAIALDRSTLDAWRSTGVLIPFQQGMRNADGSPRREKLRLRLDEVPKEHGLHLDF